MTAPLTSIAAGLPASVPFVGPEALERARGRPFRARLGANESAFGPAPGAIAAMHEAATDGWKYGDPENYDLKHAIAARHGVTPAHVVVGEGIDALFGVVARLHVEPGVAVVTSLGAYPTFAFHIAGNGGRLVTASYRDDREDLDALLALARTERPRLVFLANPDNPMGSWWDAAAGRGVRRRAAARRAAVPGRGIRRLRTCRRVARDRPGRSASAAVPHVLQGARHGGPSRRVRLRSAGGRRGVRSRPQPFRRQPRGPGRSARVARRRRPYLVCRRACRARSRPDRGDRDGQRTACPAVGHQLRDGRLRPTTARSHGRCWRPSPSATCSSACRAWRRSIAASASARHLTTSSTCWPPSSRAPSQRRIVCARRTTDRRLPAVPSRGAWSRAGRRDGRDRR